jgi:hypothetical protein
MMFLVICRRVPDDDTDAFARLVADEGAVLRKLQADGILTEAWSPGGPGAVGDPIAPGAVSEREHFLTARWTLFSAAAGRPVSARACHQPWPLHRATAEVLDDGLVAAAGLPAPRGAPLVHYSPGVDVAIGRPER